MLRYIDNNFFQEAIQINPRSEIEITYKKYSDSHGYWVVKNLFSNFSSFVKLSELFPVYYTNIDYDGNPFLKQKFPATQIFYVKNFLSEFCYTKLNQKVNFMYHNDYGNIYQHGKVYCTMKSILPHTDGYLLNTNFLVSNIWLSQGYNGGTSFWKYKDHYTCVREYNKVYENLSDEMVLYRNYEGDSNLVEVDRAPAEYGTMTMYMANQFHSAFVNTDPEHIRWSYAIMTHPYKE